MNFKKERSISFYFYAALILVWLIFSVMILASCYRQKEIPKEESVSKKHSGKITTIINTK